MALPFTLKPALLLSVLRNRKWEKNKWKKAGWRENEREREKERRKR